MMILLLDLLTYLFAVIPAVITWGSFLYISVLINSSLYKVLFIIFGPIWLVLVLAFIIFILRLLLHKMERGIYPVGINVGYISWICNLFLIRSIHISCLRPLIHSITLFKYIVYKSLGGKFSIKTSSSIHFELVDLPLLEAGENLFLGDHVKLSCHILAKGKLVLRPIKIGNNCTILSGAEVRPGTTIKDNETYPKKGEET